MSTQSCLGIGVALQLPRVCACVCVRVCVCVCVCVCVHMYNTIRCPITAGRTACSPFRVIDKHSLHIHIIYSHWETTPLKVNASAHVSEEHKNTAVYHVVKDMVYTCTCTYIWGIYMLFVVNEFTNFFVLHGYN